MTDSESLGSSLPPAYHSDDETASSSGQSSHHADFEKGSQQPLKTAKTGDQILDAIGQFGRWQACLFLTMGLALFPGTYPILVMTFMNAKVDFWCARPGHLSHLSADAWRDLSGQVRLDSSCQVWDVDYGAHGDHHGLRLALAGIETLAPKACSKWEYDTSQFGATITTEWDLVCSREYLLSVGQTVYFLGMTAGVFVVGVLTDRFGRRPTLAAVVASVCAFGAATAAAPSLPLFLAGRFLTALGAIGVLVILTTYMLEIVGGPWTSAMGVGLEYFWALAWLSLGVLAQYVTHWRHLLLATSVPGLAIAVGLIFAPESPRWLFTVGRKAEAEAILRKAAKMNGRVLPTNWKLEEEEKPKMGKEEKVSFFELFKHPQLRSKILLLYLNWFSNALVYYGLALNAGSLVGDDFYLSYMVNGAMEIPAYTAAILLLIFCGRRIPYAVTLTLAGLCLLSVLAIPSGNPTAVLVVATLGKFFVTISFASAYLYTSELVPTVLRASGVGSACFFSRLGGAAASWLALAASAGDLDWLPPAVYGGLALFCGITALALPETKGLKMPDTVEESEHVKMRSVRQALSLK